MTASPTLNGIEGGSPKAKSSSPRHGMSMGNGVEAFAVEGTEEIAPQSRFARSPARNFNDEKDNSMAIDDTLNEGNDLVDDTEKNQGEKSKGKRIYVGNISYDVNDNDLLDYCSKEGLVVVKADVLMSGGRSKGCGVVEYETAEQALKAIEILSETEWLGRRIFAREDRENSTFFRERKTDSYSSGRGGTQLFIKNLPYNVAWQELKDLFKRYGNVVRADIVTNYDGLSKGCGIVIFENSDDAKYAIDKLDGSDMDGRRIEVREDRHPERSSGVRRNDRDRDRGGYRGGSGGYRDDYNRSSRYDDRRGGRYEDRGRYDDRRDRYDDRERGSYRSSRSDDRHTERRRDHSPIARSRSPVKSMDYDRGVKIHSIAKRDDDEDINLYD